MAVAESQGIESELIPKITTGFCSGIARTGGLCGALSGAILGLNLLTGRSEAGEPVDENYALVKALVDQFEEKYGSTSCKNLTGVDLGTAEGQEEFREKNQKLRCLHQAEEATRIVLSLVEGKE